MTFEERAPPSYPPHTSFSDFPSCLTRFTKSTYALLKTTPSETRMHSSKKKKKLRGRGENAELADPDLIQSLHFFESISLASVCVCVWTVDWLRAAAAQVRNAQESPRLGSSLLLRLALRPPRRASLAGADEGRSRRERLFHGPQLRQVAFGGYSIEKWTRRRPIPVTKLIHKSRVCVYSLPIPTLASLSGAERRRDPIGSRTVACRCARPSRGREGSIPW